jgi:hypothetical protein
MECFGKTSPVQSLKKIRIRKLISPMIDLIIWRLNENFEEKIKLNLKHFQDKKLLKGIINAPDLVLFS